MVTNVFANIFGSSPVRPLQLHMAEVTACVSELSGYFDAVIKEDWKEARIIHKSISKREREADKLKKQLRLSLPKGIMLPVSRRDLLEVLTMQDNVANKAKDVSGLILGRKMVFPEELGEKIKEFVERVIDTCIQANVTVNELDELVETGFKGSEIQIVESMIKKLDKIESETDKIQITIRSKLYKLEKELPPIDVMFMYKIIEGIGDVADISQRVGSRLQLMLAR